MSQKISLLLAIFVLIPCQFVVAQQTPVRKLAPGVLTTIPPEPTTDETFQGPIPLTKVTGLDWTPNYAPKSETLRARASRVVLRRNIWNLEFTFKPLRMIPVDIPQPSGKMQRKLIWYMVYRVRNNGGHLNPVPIADRFGHEVYGTETADAVLNYGASAPSENLRFFPHFVLRDHESGKSYLDRIIPVAIPVIQRREMKVDSPPLFNSVEITRIGLPVSTPDAPKDVWGVVTWEDVDPRTDYLSIFVQGLTNAFRLVETPEGVANLSKTLQLNFWRPGDAVYEHEKEIRYGVPAVANEAEQAKILKMYGIQERLDHLWVYR